MNEIMRVILVIASGMILGVFYFGVSRITLTMLPKMRFPALFGIASFLIRTGLIAVVIAGTTHFGTPHHLIYILTGFTLSRLLLPKKTRPAQPGEVKRSAGGMMDKALQ